MTMGSKDDEQAGLFVTYKEVPRSGGHPFYEALEAVLRSNGFDRFVERECESFYSDRGRPSLAPGVYFRCLLIGFFARSEQILCCDLVHRSLRQHLRHDFRQPRATAGIGHRPTEQHRLGSKRLSAPDALEIGRAHV